MGKDWYLERVTSFTVLYDSKGDGNYVGGGLTIYAPSKSYASGREGICHSTWTERTLERDMAKMNLILSAVRHAAAK